MFTKFLPGDGKPAFPVQPLAKHISCPVGSSGGFSPLIFMLGPCPSLGCLPLAISKLGHLSKQASRNSLGRH